MNERSLLIMTATYNEAENVESLCAQIAALQLGADLLIVNDRSSDGTDAIVHRLAQENDWVHVLQRESKQGVGSAHRAGINWAYEHNYRLLVTMDADFTHLPGSISLFLSKELDSDVDVVVGSRFLEKESLPEWSLFRRFLTHFGHFMTKALLGMPLDATGSFRLYRLDRIPRSAFDLVRSKGYSFFFESLYILWFNGVTMAEIPIVLPDRIQGHSKMVLNDAIQSFRFLLRLFRRRAFAPQTLRCSELNERRGSEANDKAHSASPHV